MSDRPGASRIQSIDGLRTIACLMVLLFHTAQFASVIGWHAAVVAHFSVGVDIFISLSGFCLFYSVVVRPERFRTDVFFRSRVRRIVPAYYASILFCAVLLPEGLVLAARAAGHHASWQPVPGPGQWIAHATFTHMLSLETWDGINGSYWSMGLEAEFYLLSPLLVLLFRRFGIRGLFMPAAISAGWNTVLGFVVGWNAPFSPALFLWQANVFGKWIQFVGGMAAAWLVVHHPIQGNRYRRRAVMGVALTMIALDLWSAFGFELGPFSIYVITVGVGLLLWAIGEDRGPWARMLCSRPLVALGVISYSFYLVHQPMAWFSSQFGRALGLTDTPLWAFELSAGAAAITSVAWLSNVLFERPPTRQGRSSLEPEPIPRDLLLASGVAEGAK